MWEICLQGHILSIVGDCPAELALKLKAREREKEIQQDMQQYVESWELRLKGMGSKANKIFLQEKIVVLWELDPLTPEVYLVIELQNGGLALSLINKISEY